MSHSVQPLPEVLVLGAFAFPEGNAAANYLRGHAAAIQGAGFTVGFLPQQQHGREEDRQPDGSFAYRGIPYWPVRRSFRSSPTLRRIYFGLRRHFGLDDDHLIWLSSRGGLTGFRAVLVYTGVANTCPLLIRLRRLCRRAGIKLFVYVVEWREPGRHGVPLLSPGTIDGEIQRRFVNHTLDGVICISKYLEEYYSARGCRTVLMPPLLDLNDPMLPGPHVGQPPAGEELRLVFSGAHRRERHDIILRAVLAARRQGARVVLEYLGCGRGDINAQPGVTDGLLDALGDGVRFHGRVPREEMLRIVASASFGVLLREDSRWSRACFPSKVPEMLALGVPVICNLTSDLGGYLRDSQNALLVKDVSVEAFGDVLRNAAAMGRDRRHEMRAAARQSAAQFDAARYSDVYRDLIGSRTATPLGPDQRWLS